MTLPDFHSAAREEKEWLVDELEHSASWYVFRTEKCCNDEHDADCARALYELAEVIRALPLTHPLFLKLAEINCLYLQEADVVGLGNWLNETKCLMKQICFSSFKKPKDLVERLVELTDEHQAGCRDA